MRGGTGAITAAKENAAKGALQFVRDGQVIGLGTGSTVSEFAAALAARAKEEELELEIVSSSVKSEVLAKRLGLRVVGLDEVAGVDLAVDGADQIDPAWNLLKGLGGGAITREKMLDYYAKRFVVIGDESKPVRRLAGAVPLEVVRFAIRPILASLKRLGATHAARRTGPGELLLVTDNGNYILDATFPRIPSPTALETELNLVPGILESGIFSKRTPDAVVIGDRKSWRLLKRG